MGDTREKAAGKGTESGVMADPYRLGYRDPPFRSKSLKGNPGMARPQLGNAPLQRRLDILIRQDV
jgi:hypothetical protein